MQKYNEHTSDTGDWPSWRRLVLSELESLRAEVKDLQQQSHVTATELALMKLKIAVFVALATLVVSPVAGWIVRKIGLEP